VAFAVLLFLVEPVWLMKAVRPHFGASLTTVLAVYAAFGWVLGALSGMLSGLVGRAVARVRRSDGTVPGLGTTLGFLFMALFIVRNESMLTLKTMPSNLIVSLVAAVLVWVGLGYLGRRFLTRYIPVARRSLVLNVLAVVAVFGFIGAVVLSMMGSVRLPRRTAASADSPNVVLVVVDALRADHLSCYGYDRETSPNLDEFAENSVLFGNAYSHGNRTIFAMPSLFTSLYPSFHGTGASWGEKVIPLPANRTTIADVCRDAGYTTVGLMSNINLKTPFGMTKGFDYAEEFDALRYRLSVYRVFVEAGLAKKPLYLSHAPNATVVTDSGIELLAQMKDRPFFLFVHYMDVHHPYNPPAHYVKMFETVGSEIDPNILFEKTAILVKRPMPLRLPGEELTRLIDLYDAGIRYTDDEIGRLLDELASLDLERETVVIFTSDHGDEFLEQGMLYHNNLAIETLIQVPLIIGRIPARNKFNAGDSREMMVRHVDILPTVADLVGGKTPPNVHGASLVAWLSGRGGWDAEYSIAEGDFCTSVNKGPWKMMYVDTTSAYHFYKLDEDPLGLVDVGDRYPAEAAELRAILDEYLRAVAELPQGDQEQLSDEAVKQLRALGYIE
jgi:arylsulfatase A-like enzyme